MADIKSKKSKIIFDRASDSALIGMNVANESRAMLESGFTLAFQPVLGYWGFGILIPTSP
jgi:hypothetical protein